MTYWPRLDGLRALAIALVLAEHFTPWSASRSLHLGTIGVHLFFVLSGFLITRILLGSRSLPVTHAATRFYWRRLLRLSPPYYLAILLAVAFGLGDASRTWVTNASYLANFRVAWQAHWDGSSHFWSLAVEEQFYLLWFAVVVMLPRRWLSKAICGAIVLAPVCRGVFVMFGFGHIGSSILLPDCMDALALGALLAVLFDTPWMRHAQRPPLLLISCAALVLSYAWNGAWMADVLRPSIVGVTSFFLIAAALAPRCRALDWLSWAPIRHIGRISYGIYVYHYFMPEALPHYAPWFRPSALKFSIALVVLSFLAAELSWHLLERPILVLKDWTPKRGLAPNANHQW